MEMLLIMMLLFVVLFVSAIVSIVNKKGPSNEYLIWLILVLFMPILGSFIYFMFGRPQLVMQQIRHSKTHFFKY